jgi:hypothetical protein
LPGSEENWCPYAPLDIQPCPTGDGSGLIDGSEALAIPRCRVRVAATVSASDAPVPFAIVHFTAKGVFLEQGRLKLGVVSVVGQSIAQSYFMFLWEIRGNLVDEGLAADLTRRPAARAGKPLYLVDPIHGFALNPLACRSNLKAVPVRKGLGSDAQQYGGFGSGDILAGNFLDRGHGRVSI